MERYGTRRLIGWKSVALSVFPGTAGLFSSTWRSFHPRSGPAAYGYSIATRHTGLRMERSSLERVSFFASYEIPRLSVPWSPITRAVAWRGSLRVMISRSTLLLVGTMARLSPIQNPFLPRCNSWASVLMRPL